MRKVLLAANFNRALLKLHFSDLMQSSFHKPYICTLCELQWYKPHSVPYTCADFE